jgi:dUTPase
MYYPIALYNQSDKKAGFDLYTSETVTIGSTGGVIAFGIMARLIKVEKVSNGESTELVKTESHFYLAPRESIYKTGLMMANSLGIIDKCYRAELKAPVWSMVGDTTVQIGTRMFQILAPDMGWIRNITLVDSIE